MENIVTLFLLFTYSTILGLVAFKLLIYDKRKARAKLRERARRKASSKEDFLIKLTDPVFNAQCEINRMAKSLRKKFISASTENTPENNTESRLNEAASSAGLTDCGTQPAVMNSGRNNASVASAAGSPAAANDNKAFDDNVPLKYELDERTLGLLINTLSYDDFAVLYEKFLYAKNDDEVCSLINELQNFVDDDRVIMIVTPLLSYPSLKVQDAVNDFITKNNIYLKADEMADIIENSEYYETRNENSQNKQFVPLFSTEAVPKYSMPFGSSSAGASDVNIDLEKYEPEFTIEKDVFEKQPHELIMEAYQTEDKDRLFALSCALSQYNDPTVLEAMMYINAKLNGENVSGPKIIKSQKIKNENGILNAPSAAYENKKPSVQKYEFGSVGNIFKKTAPEINNRSIAKDFDSEQKQNSYIKGMKLVNVAKYSKFEEIFPEAINNLNDNSAYVRCCAITALKTIANNCFKQNMNEQCQKTKETILSHMVFEKNNEVSSLCAKAVAEIENFSNASAEFFAGDDIKAASNFINKQINHELIERQLGNNVSESANAKTAV
ncbi:MAG: hypothetical protein QMC67_10875 [Candidatus Wallbacteria bacterium]